MVFVDSRKALIEETVKFFDKFGVRAGLTINLEKSTLYLAGVSETHRNDITESFLFSLAQFSVKYLGLHLLTKRILKANYIVLVEKIRLRFDSWTARYLSYAGKL